MESESDRQVGWEALVTLINQSSATDRSGYREILRTFAHDMRQTIGQVEAAEKLLRRIPHSDEGAETWGELLDIIKAAHTAAQDILSEFVTQLVEPIENE